MLAEEDWHSIAGDGEADGRGREGYDAFCVEFEFSRVMRTKVKWLHSHEARLNSVRVSK